MGEQNIFLNFKIISNWWDACDDIRKYLTYFLIIFLTFVSIIFVYISKQSNESILHVLFHSFWVFFLPSLFHTGKATASVIDTYDLNKTCKANVYLCDLESEALPYADIWVTLFLHQDLKVFKDPISQMFLKTGNVNEYLLKGKCGRPYFDQI